ncbi:hypothetical protein [Aquimarina macrocephali]|uniref:hypothetical protein n=1 Tax=Aquimarina macrocephali TaxID=666563 RepID=UPI003F67938D
MKNLTITIILLLFIQSSWAKDINFKVVNKTEQKILKLEYWFGSQSESMNPGLIYKSKGSIDKLGVKNLILDFHKRRRNTLLIKAYLNGGGYLKDSYTVDKGEITPTLDLINIMQKVPADEFTKVKSKFTELKLDSKNLKISTQTGINSLIGSVIVYDEDGNEIHKIDPKILKTKISQTSLPNLKQTITGIFSSETTASASVNLPIVTLSSAFSTGDVANFTWEIENVGQYNWSSENGLSLAQMFLALPQDTKDVLVQLYKDRPKITMRFIDKAFVIGRLKITTKKSRKVNSKIELNASNFVTGKGNYDFIDDLTRDFTVSGVITEVKGYEATHLLRSLYLKEEARVSRVLAKEEKQRLKNEYNSLLELYPQYLKQTNNINTMKIAIRNLSSDKNNELRFVKKALKEENINLSHTSDFEIVRQQQ